MEGEETGVRGDERGRESVRGDERGRESVRGDERGRESGEEMAVRVTGTGDGSDGSSATLPSAAGEQQVQCAAFLIFFCVLKLKFPVVFKRILVYRQRKFGWTQRFGKYWSKWRRGKCGGLWCSREFGNSTTRRFRDGPCSTGL